MGKTIKLVEIKRKQVIPRSVVEEIERLLAEIKSGRVVNIAIVAQDRALYSSFAHHAQNAPALIGGLEEMKMQVLDGWRHQ